MNYLDKGLNQKHALPNFSAGRFFCAWQIDTNWICSVQNLMFMAFLGIIICEFLIILIGYCFYVIRKRNDRDELTNNDSTIIKADTLSRLCFLTRRSIVDGNHGLIINLSLVKIRSPTIMSIDS